MSRTCGELPMAATRNPLPAGVVRVNDPWESQSNSRTQLAATRTIFPSQQRNHFSAGFPNIGKFASPRAGSTGRAITMPLRSNSRNQPVTGNRPFLRTTQSRNVREFSKPARFRATPESAPAGTTEPAPRPDGPPDHCIHGPRTATTVTGPDRIIGPVTSTSRSNSPHRPHLKTDHLTRLGTSVAERTNVCSSDPGKTVRRTTVPILEVILTCTFPLGIERSPAAGSGRTSAPIPGHRLFRRMGAGSSSAAGAYRTATRAYRPPATRYSNRRGAAADRTPRTECSGCGHSCGVAPPLVSRVIRLLRRLGSPSATKDNFADRIGLPLMAMRTYA